MIYKEIIIPREMDNIRKFWATIYSEKSKQTYTLWVELDSEDKEVIAFGCVCKGVMIPQSMGKEISKCKHIKDFVKLIKQIGYMK